MFLNSDISRKW